MEYSYIDRLKGDDIREFIFSMDFVDRINGIYHDKDHWLISLRVVDNNEDGVLAVAPFPVNYRLYNDKVTTVGGFLPAVEEKFLARVQSAWSEFLDKTFSDEIDGNV